MDALAQVQAAGLTAFILADGRLGVTPAERITPELRDFIKAHKGAILEELQWPPSPYPWPAILGPGPWQEIPAPGWAPEDLTGWRRWFTGPNGEMRSVT